MNQTVQMQKPTIWKPLNKTTSTSINITVSWSWVYQTSLKKTYMYLTFCWTNMIESKETLWEGCRGRLDSSNEISMLMVDLSPFTLLMNLWVWKALSQQGGYRIHKIASNRNDFLLKILQKKRFDVTSSLKTVSIHSGH